jgi:hypothetical protein
VTSAAAAPGREPPPSADDEAPVGYKPSEVTFSDIVSLWMTNIMQTCAPAGALRTWRARRPVAFPAPVVQTAEVVKRSDGKLALIARGYQHRDRVLPAVRKVAFGNASGQKHEATKIMPERIGCEQ